MLKSLEACHSIRTSAGSLLSHGLARTSMFLTDWGKGLFPNHCRWRTSNMGICKFLLHKPLYIFFEYLSLCCALLTTQFC